MLPMWWLPGTAGTTTGVAVIPPLVLCGVLLPWLVVGMVAHVTAVMMCDMVSARYAALCARSGALT
ncbi:TPA: hypothetical protein ACHKKV_004920 [Escherichia coli]